MIKKPLNMPLRAFIERRISIDKAIPENVIHKVVSFMFDSAREAMMDNMTVEISGFGKFTFNVKKAIKQIDGYRKNIKYFEKLLENETSEKRIVYLNRKMKTEVENLEIIIKKLKKNGIELETDL